MLWGFLLTAGALAAMIAVACLEMRRVDRVIDAVDRELEESREGEEAGEGKPAGEETSP